MPENTPHTVQSYDAELRRLHDLVRRMGALAEQQVADASAALIERDAAKAAAVIARDAELDALQRDVEAQVVRLLALRQPVAVDLRVVLAGLKISSDLERVGDYAANAAKRGIVLAGLPRISSLNGLQQLAKLVLAGLHNAMAAYATADAEIADAVWASDVAADEIHTSIFRELLTHMLENPRTITAATHLLFVAKNLERIGDHATNIAETVHFAARGEPLPAERPKADAASEPDAPPD